MRLAALGSHLAGRKEYDMANHQPSSDRTSTEHRTPESENARKRLLERLPVTERRLRLAGVSTAVLEGGSGPPIVLLHGPGGFAAHWMRLIPDLVESHRVVAPDLPGHGASEVEEGELDSERVLRWLGELIEQTCAAAPTLVGQLLGGAIAARFAVDHSQRIARLVLIDTFGLIPFEPAPEFGLALQEFFAAPTEATHEKLWQHCARNLPALQQRMGTLWQPFEAYNLERARAASQQAALHQLLRVFAAPQIPGAHLARITAPTILIWGRHDLATPLAFAESASARYGWPLHVIEDSNDDPPIEQPEAVLRVLLSSAALS
jgi:pimeloyl-ACP methyl ester carboxylesterase